MAIVPEYTDKAEKIIALLPTLTTRGELQAIHQAMKSHWRRIESLQNGDLFEKFGIGKRVWFVHAYKNHFGTVVSHNDRTIGVAVDMVNGEKVDPPLRWTVAPAHLKLVEEGNKRPPAIDEVAALFPPFLSVPTRPNLPRETK